MKYIITTIAFLITSAIAFNQNSDYNKLDSYFDILEENNRFFGSVAATRNGEVIYSNAIGYADIESQISNSNETKFRIGSISKTFTATLIMQAVEKGEIGLDDTVQKYFPKIENADRITVRHLLNHRSGITDFTDASFFSWYTKPISQSAILDTITHKGVDFNPDTDYSYSNSNYVLLTFVLEAIYNEPYAKLLEQKIVKPLGLKNTSYGRKTNPTLNEARSYQMKDDWTLEPEGDMSIPLGAGGIISTPTDLCLFSEALSNGKLISTKSLELMKPVDGQEYGFALYGMPMLDRSGWGHGGNIDAFSSSLTHFEEDGLSFAITCNGSNFGSNDIAIAVMSELLGKPYELPSFESVELTSEELDLYLGVYVTEELPMEFTIAKDGSSLSLGVTGQSSSALLARGDHKFSIMKYGVKITFVPSEKKMHFNQNGMEFELSLKEASEPEEVIELELDLDLDQYQGIYESGDLPMDLTISREGNTLMGQGTGQPSFPLTSEGNHEFSNEQIGLTITFMPNDKKMTFVQGGAEFEMAMKK